MIKQVIVIRKDLRNTKGEKVRSGKLMVQVAHASMGGLFNYFRNGVLYFDLLPEVVRGWINGNYAKVCVYVNSEEELLEIYNKALAQDINARLIVDQGLTEFGGILTNTCLSLGPDYSEKLDPLTGHLSLV